MVIGPDHRFGQFGSDYFKSLGLTSRFSYSFLLLGLEPNFFLQMSLEFCILLSGEDENTPENLKTRLVESNN